jgi:hypothetical protein
VLPLRQTAGLVASVGDSEAPCRCPHGTALRGERRMGGPDLGCDPSDIYVGASAALRADAQRRQGPGSSDGRFVTLRVCHWMAVRNPAGMRPTLHGEAPRFQPLMRRSGWVLPLRRAAGLVASVADSEAPFRCPHGTALRGERRMGGPDLGCDPSDIYVGASAALRAAAQRRQGPGSSGRRFVTLRVCHWMAVRNPAGMRPTLRGKAVRMERCEMRAAATTWLRRVRAFRALGMGVARMAGCDLLARKRPAKRTTARIPPECYGASIATSRRERPPRQAASLSDPIFTFAHDLATSEWRTLWVDKSIHRGRSLWGWINPSIGVGLCGGG